MKKELVDLKETRNKVDDLIITANITLIAAFIIILSIKKPEVVYVAYSSIISLFGLIASLLLSLWHKFRHPLRQNLFENEKSRLTQNISSDIAEFAKNFIIIPFAKKSVFSKEGNQELTKEELSNLYDKEYDQKNTEKVMATYFDKLSFQLKEAHELLFNKPLDESNPNMKFVVDKLARSFRYSFFVLGIIFFFVAIIINLVI